MNKVYLIGNLTRDPELAETQSGVAVCRFSIAVNRPYANAEGVKEADIVLFVNTRDYKVWRKYRGYSIYNSHRYLYRYSRERVHRYFLVCG